MKAKILGLLAATLLAATAATHAAIINFAATLGPETVGATGSGTVLVIWDDVAHLMAITADFSGLSGTTTAAHIHCCTAVPGTGNAGVATTTPSFVGFPLGVTAGTFSNTLDMTLASSYNPAFVTANGGLANAEAALLQGMLAGRTYFNIHTTTFGGGEIRGYLQQVPEPGTLALLGLGLTGLALSRRRKAA